MLSNATRFMLKERADLRIYGSSGCPGAAVQRSELYELRVNGLQWRLSRRRREEVLTVTHRHHEGDTAPEVQFGGRLSVKNGTRPCLASLTVCPVVTRQQQTASAGRGSTTDSESTETNTKIHEFLDTVILALYAV